MRPYMTFMAIVASVCARYARISRICESDLCTTLRLKHIHAKARSAIIDMKILIFRYSIVIYLWKN